MSSGFMFAFVLCSSALCVVLLFCIVCIVQHLVTYCKARVTTTEELQTVDCFIGRLFCAVSVPKDAFIKTVKQYRQKVKDLQSEI